MLKHNLRVFVGGERQSENKRNNSMPSPLVELVISALISLTLIGLGVYYFVREIVERRRNESYVRLPPDDLRHFRGQFIRRVTGSILLAAAGVAVIFGQVIIDWQESRILYVWLWTGISLGVFGIVILAGADLLSIRRYARRQRKRLEADRREMIERQIEVYRAEREAARGVPPGFDVERN
jgi:hypothetical protein